MVPQVDFANRVVGGGVLGQGLVQEEIRTLLDRLAGEVDPDRAASIIAAGAEPLRDLIGALHSKLLLQELRRQRGVGD